MYQDTYIEYWGEIFVSARIIEFGIMEAFDVLWPRVCPRGDC